MDRKALRAEVEAAALAEVELVGPEAWRADTIVRRFAGRGVDRATLYRWLQRLRESGRMGAHLAERMHEAAVARAARTDEPVVDLADEVRARLPAIPTPDTIAGGGGVVRVADELNRCLRVLDRILDECERPEGDIRLKKTALAAVEGTRRCLETAVRMAEAMRHISKVDQFNARVIDCVRRLSPELGEELLRDLDQMMVQWDRAG